MRHVVAAGLAVMLCAAAGSAMALGVEGVGGKLGYSNPENLDGTTTMGVHAELAESGTQFHLLPNMMYWKVNGVRDLSPNLDAYYHFEPEGRVSPYLGAGLGLNFVRNDRRDRSNTDVGMNFVGGVRFPGAANHYFLEGRYTASDLHQVAVLTGITFHAP